MTRRAFITDHWVFGPKRGCSMPRCFCGAPARRRDLAHEAATSGWVAKSVRNLVLRPIRQLGVDGRCRGWSHVFFLRAFGVDARRWVRWILNPPRRSFKLRVLVNRQRPMKNVTFDRATVLQLDANGTDSALDAAADCHVLRNDAALDVCAIADQEIRGAHLAFDSAEDLRWTFAFDVADDRHVGADARGHFRFCRRF